MSSATAFQPVATAKRHRTSSQSSGSSVSSREHVASKATRISPPAEQEEGGGSSSGMKSGAVHSLLCTLPPTCNHKPTPLGSTRELESHYATYHAHVCEQPGCGCVFPDARLLELHQTENHDPIAAMKKDRGDKIFACHLASCPRAFANPKARRLHLISAHGYPKEYFFAVTNKGVGGLLKKWGEGASMVRAKWKPREASSTSKTSNPQIKVDKETMRGSSSSMDVDDDVDDSDDDDMDSQDSDEEENQSPPSQTARHSFYSTLPKPDNTRMPADQDPEATPRPYASARSLPPDAADSLVSTMSTLSLVPSSVRFGRGRGGGFATASGRPAHQPKQSSSSQTHSAGDAGGKGDTTTTEIPTPGTRASGESSNTGAGPGYRGRGRGGRGLGYVAGGDGNTGVRGGRGRGRGRGRGGRGG